MKSGVLTDKTQQEIVSSALTSRGDREKRVLTQLATEHQLHKKAQTMMTEYSEHPSVFHALLDHQPHIHPTALYNIAYSPYGHAFHEKIIQRPEVDGDVLNIIAKTATPEMLHRIADHPKATTYTHHTLAQRGDDEILKKLLPHAHDFYVRQSLIVRGNDEIHNALLDAGHHDKTTTFNIHKHTKNPQTRQRVLDIARRRDAEGKMK